jgi:hypothetical protein
MTVMTCLLRAISSSRGGKPRLALDCRYINECIHQFKFKGLGAIRAKIDPISDVDKIFSKMYSQYVLFRINTVS